jgi:aminopeptidase N
VDPDYTVLARIKFTPPTEMLHAQLAAPDDLIGRLLAVEILSERRDRESVARLKRVLNEDPFYAVRVEAANALRTIHSDEALEALLASTVQADARVRRQVREALRGFYREPVLTSTRAALPAEKNPDIVAELVRTLGPYPDAGIREELLARLLSDSFRNVVADAAVAAMRAQDDPAFIAPLLEALRTREAAFTSGDFAQALGTLAHLARNEDDRTAVREFLVAQTTNRRRGVKEAALRALGMLGDPRALAGVETFATAAKDSPERRAAEEAVGRLRAARKPVDEFRALRDEVLGFQKENRELRREFEALEKKIDEGTASAPATSPAPAATKDKSKKKK